MKEKTLKDVIENAKWNYGESEKMYDEIKLTNTFESFCNRMWLDNEDENLSPHASANRMTKDEYVEKWHDWLLEQWQNRDYKDDTN